MLNKLKDFFAKLENFTPKLIFSEIPVSVGAGKSVKNNPVLATARLVRKYRTLTRFWPSDAPLAYFGCAILLEGQKNGLSRQIDCPFLPYTSSLP